MILILTSKKKFGKKTKEFLKLLGAHLLQKKISFSVKSFEDIEIFLSNENIQILLSGTPLSVWSTIFPRKTGNYTGAAFILASYAKKNEITFIDRFREKTNDITKLIQTYLFAENKIPIPKTYYTPSYTKEHLENAIQFLGTPLVVKQCNTSKGSGVRLVKNRKELRKTIEIFYDENPKKEIILQEFIENTFEYRIFIAGSTLATAEKKIRTTEGEFRNNVHLGAKEEFIKKTELKKEIVNIAKKAAKITNIQVAGVDIAEDKDGNPFVFEVNSCPAFTLDEKVSNEIQQLANYLVICEKK